MPNFLIIGCGFSGAVLANELVHRLDCKVTIWDERPHIAGNCYTQRDEHTDVMVHKYGPHIFNTHDNEVWEYVNNIVPFVPYVHRVKGVSGENVYSLPINLHTINQYFKKTFSPSEAKQFLSTLLDGSIINPKNFEEQALAFIGRELYEAFFYGYTKKQWGCEPSELPASILKRIPVRFSYDDNYHPGGYTGIPRDGYTAVIEKLIQHPSIKVALNTKFVAATDVTGFDHVFFTGALDSYFNHKYGRLGYRTVVFEKEYGDGDFQGTSQINYCDLDVSYTRITEHKHFAPWETHKKTVIFKEYSKETEIEDEPFYPKRLIKDKILLKKYRDEANKLTGISFLGRLATYRYMDMHHVIREALDFSNKFALSFIAKKTPPVFANTETV